MRPTELLSRLDTFVSELDHDEARRALTPDTIGLAGRLGEAIDRWAEATEAEEDALLEECSVCRRLAAATWTSLLPKAADPITGRRLRGARERRWCRCPECGTAYDYEYDDEASAPAADAETLVRASDLGTAVAVQLRHLVKSGSSGLVAAILGNLRALRALLAGPPPAPAAAPRKSRPSRARPLACLLGVLLGGAALAHAYDAPGGDFRIAFPSDPMVDAAGTNGASYKVADGDRVYVVRRLSCEAECAAQADDARFYDDFQRQGLAALKGTLQSQRAVTSGTHAGREMVIHAESKRTGQPYEMTARVFRLGRDVYVVSSTTPRQPAARGAALGVLDSFVLLK